MVGTFWTGAGLPPVRNALWNFCMEQEVIRSLQIDAITRNQDRFKGAQNT